MCFAADSRPPIPPLAGAAVDGQRIELESADGTQFAAYSAHAGTPTGAGMLILPDVRGLHPYFEELALRFAEAGIDALAIDYFGRTAGSAERGADFDHQPHIGQVSYDALMADAAAGAAELRGWPDVRALLSVGFCFGGRLSFVSAARSDLDLAGAIGFYGWPVGDSRGAVPAPIDLVDDMSCPVLGLFGGADRAIPAEDVEAFRDALAGAGVEHEIVTYPEAPHSFFDRKAAEFGDASTDAWRRVIDFVSRLTPPA
jgi:carboxymethylenebutenolidase